jgi:hypothetical protein
MWNFGGEYREITKEGCLGFIVLMRMSMRNWSIRTCDPIYGVRRINQFRLMTMLMVKK